MKFCQPHWDALRAAIESRGLGHLVAANGRDVFARMVAELEGRSDVDDFDPLMGAHNLIISKVMQGGGLYLMTGDYCPVCEFCKHVPPPPAGHRYPTNEAYMIDGPADAMLEEARRLGLFPALRSSEVSP